MNSRWEGFSTDKNAVARLILKRIYEKLLGNNRVLFYEGVYGRHSFISLWHQFIHAQREKLRRNTAGNVDLPGNLHDMVRIAYAIPRVIPLITLGDSSSINMFPTDLHGAVSPGFYVSSLRIGGKANAQVDRLKKLVLSYMDVSAFRQVYALGKNHMQELRDPGSFRCASHRSKTYGLPLPLHATAYRELRETGSFDAGIHRIHFYEQEHEERLNDRHTLAHIHQYYAQWRLNLGLPTNMLLR
jgi:flavin reductase (DIM6/NTAB) family NADH-FMN oxidoreductase RutF